MNYEELIKSFLRDALDTGQIQHFGYLLIPDDKQLIDEAVSCIRQDFKKFSAPKEVQS